MKYFLLIFFLLLSACQVGELTPEREALYTKNTVDCNKTPQKCIDGYPW
ncbi:MAG: hypothetical protein IJV97_00460 [Alphaproteobacteria bacterium]|nr:hypothetical protein [Alphaproteobacteria bacterium]